VQTITFLGLAGFLCIAKEITKPNKVYVSKRWTAYCAGAGVINAVSEIKMNELVSDVIEVQARLHQTALGRPFARRVLDHKMVPQKIKDQIVLVYTFAGMKASVTMYSYLSTGPLALVLPSVYEDARNFKTVYEALRTSSEDINFPYTQLMGGGENLNHAHFPDLYYCAVSSSKRSGALGDRKGNFAMSSLPTRADTAVLDRLCKHASAGLELSDHSLARWKTAAEEMGATVSDQDLKRVKKKLCRGNDSDLEEEVASKRARLSEG